jgi:putative ABC transport system permease protein
MRRLGFRLATRWRALTGTASAAAVALGLLACLCTLLAVSGPRAANRLHDSAFRQFIAAAPAADKTVIGSLDDNTLSTGQPDGLSAGQIQLIGNQLRRNLRGLPLAPATASWTSLTTPAVDVTVAHHSPALRAALPPKLELSYRSTLASAVRVVAGRLPAGQPGSGASTILQAAVTTPTARRFGLVVGSRLALPGTGIVLAVSGIVQPRDPAAPFWTADPAVAAPALIYSGTYDLWLGGAFIGADAVSTLQARFNMTATQVTWNLPLDLNRLTAAQASQLRPQLAGALTTAGHVTSTSTTTVRQCSTKGRKPAIFRAGKKLHIAERCANQQVQVPLSIAMTSGAGPLITMFQASEASVSSVLDLLSVSLAVLAAVVLLLAAWLLAERRRQEFAVLRARGAARRQLGIAAFGGGAVTVLPGAAAGLVIGLALTPSTPAPLAWWLAGLEVLAALAGPALFTIWLHRDYAPAAATGEPHSRLAPARRLIVEAALVLVAVGGLLVLREQGLRTGGPAIYPSAAPALLAVGLAVIVLRAYPPLVRALLQLTRRRPGAAAFIGLARAARVPVSATLPAFAMVLALALVSFAAMVRGAVIRGEIAASWQRAGADAVISSPEPVTARLQRTVAAMPGVQHVAEAGVAVGSSPSVGQFSVLLVDPRQYAAVLAASPLPQLPAAFTATGTPRGTARGGTARPTPVLASPAMAAKVGRSPITVLLDGQRLIRVRVVGEAPAMSAVAAASAGYLVLNRQAAVGLAAGLGLAPDALLVAGSSVNPADVRAAVSRYAPGATIVFRSRLLARLDAAPLRHGAYLALLLGASAAACCCLLALLLSLLLSAAPRQQALARMSTMGLSPAQGGVAALIELLPQLLAVLAGGLACAVVLVPALGPALSLTAFTGSTTPVPVHVEPEWLAGTAIALLVLAITTLAGQTMVASRGVPRSLRIGE